MVRLVLSNVPLLRLPTMLRKRKLAYLKQICYDRCVNNSALPPNFLLSERKNHTIDHTIKKRKENGGREAEEIDKE